MVGASPSGSLSIGERVPQHNFADFLCKDSFLYVVTVTISILPNTYFQFKQFTIHQDRCAMKVTTDGCLFGAIAANEISNYGTCSVLDIGTGTGLLSLMVAQQNKAAAIDAIETNKAAAQQATENIAASPWPQRIQVIQDDILAFKPSVMYDVVICNPPFYEKQLSSPITGRQQAHHSSQLTLLQLFQQVKSLLKPDGKFFVLMPFYRNEETLLLAKQNSFYPQKQWRIKQTPTHNWFRSIFCFSRHKINTNQSFELSIKDANNDYSTAFIQLLQPYYLRL